MINGDKAAGSMLGSVLGDVLGWPFEQNSKNVARENTKTKGEVVSWKKTSMAPYYAHVEHVERGSYSDDTQLILAVTRSRLRGDDWANYFSKFELPFWLSYERGGGGATKRSARSWKNGIQPWKSKKDSFRYYNAGGNGVAMRVLPHVLYDDELSMVLESIFLDATMTHGHPRAILGAQLFGQALKFLLTMEDELNYGELIEYLKNNREWSLIPCNDYSKNWLKRANVTMQGKYSAIWEDVVNEVVGYLNLVSNSISHGAFDSLVETLDKLGCFDKKRNGAGTITAVAAIYVVSKRVVEPLKGLCEVAYLKNADTDTLASMVGGLFGSLYGTAWLNEYRNCFQDYNYIYDLSQKISKKNLISNVNNFENWTDKDEKQLKNQIKSKESLIKIKNFGEIKLKEYNEFEAKSNNNIGQAKYMTTFNQALYFTLIKKKSNGEVKRTLEGKNFKTSDDIPSGGKIAVKDLADLLDIIPPRITAKRFLSEMLEIEKEKNQGIKFENLEVLKKKSNIDIEVYRKIYTSI